MLEGIYIANTGMNVQQRKQEYISQNLNNTETTGYKRETVACESFPEMLMQRVRGQRARDAAYIGSTGRGVAVTPPAANFEAGSLVETGRKMDLAIDGEGFFAVTTADGVRYTRNGAFCRNDAGYLVTAGGDPVLGQNGQILASEQVTVTAGGVIMADGEEVDRLLLTTFENLEGLQKTDKGLFKADNTANPRVSQERVVLKQGFLEQANVDLASEMAEMVTVMRVYELNQRMLQAQDQLMGKSIEEIGKLR
ncbi:MAG: flagellar hook-basal body protein [Bacillota bacterium]|jgi:flagellar basal-body rod protein FlgF